MTDSRMNKLDALYLPEGLIRFLQSHMGIWKLYDHFYFVMTFNVLSLKVRVMYNMNDKSNVQQILMSEGSEECSI